MPGQSVEDPKSIYSSRLEKLYTAMTPAGLKAVILNPGPSLVYFTGLHFHLSERPVIAVFTPNNPIRIILPEFESGKTDSLPFAVNVFPYSEDPSTWAGITSQGLKAADPEDGSVGVEPRRLRYLELSLLQEASPNLVFSSAEDVIAGLRMSKEELEIEYMQRAANIAQEALLATLPQITAGKSEKEIESSLILELVRAGTDLELPFSPIIASGPNSANPHATAGPRKLGSGDLLVIDWGAAHNGYFSDITRTIAIGEIDPRLENIAAIVKEANAAARSLVRPGIPAKDVDIAARSIIQNAGYGEYFLHRTGHGLGLEVHEEPFIRGDNELILQEGMTFTIEPGIYLPGQGGVRIEDNVYVTGSGSKSLTDLPRELFRIE